jgi:predicted enzyme related to lactoylglutathione lyase
MRAISPREHAETTNKYKGEIMPQPIVHFEIAAKDAKTLQRFYSTVFGWKINADNPMNYGVVDAKQGAPFGIDGGIFQHGAFQNAAPEDVPGIRIYAGVDDADGYMAKIEQAGGKIVYKADEVPGMGIRIGVAQDPEGNMIGVVQQLGPMPGQQGR